MEALPSTINLAFVAAVEVLRVQKSADPRETSTRRSQALATLESINEMDGGLIPGFERAVRGAAVRAYTMLLGHDYALRDRHAARGIANIKAMLADRAASLDEVSDLVESAALFGDYPLARKLLDDWSRLAPGSPGVLIARAAIEREEGHWAAVLHVAREASRLDLSASEEAQVANLMTESICALSGLASAAR